MQMRSKWKAVAINTAVVIASTLLTYLVLGHLILRFYLPYLPPIFLSELPDLPAIVGQTSKRADLPRDYIAILGDSYAEGIGDARADAGPNGMARDHSAHVVQDLTGHDVISLGRWGYGSAQAMVLKPGRVYDGACPAYPTPETPRAIVVYFYEGNDFIDNYRWVEIRLPAALTGDTAGKIEKYFNQDYGAPAWWRCYTYFGLTLRELARMALGPWVPALAKPQVPPNPPAPPGTAQSGPAAGPITASEAAALANIHLGPSLYLTDRQFELATIVFSRSLAWLRRRFPNTPILMAYLPSPIVVYRLRQTTLLMREAAPTLVPRQPAEFYAASQRMCTLIQTLTAEQGARFLDTRPALRAAAAIHPLYGPMEWEHFNGAGYRALGQAVAQALDRTGDQGCVDWDVER